MLLPTIAHVPAAGAYLLDHLYTRNLPEGIRRCRELGITSVDLMVRGDYTSNPKSRFSIPESYALETVHLWYYPRKSEGPDTKFYDRISSGQIKLLPRVVRVGAQDWEAERERAEWLMEQDIRTIIVPGAQSLLEESGLEGNLHAVFMRER